MKGKGAQHGRIGGRTALILGVLWLLAAGAMCLTFREYGRSAVFRVTLGAGNASPVDADSVAADLCHYLRSPFVAKGGALSAMDGDFSRLLTQSLSKGELSDELESFNLKTSLFAMRKMCALHWKGKIYLSYFSTDSIATNRTFSYFRQRLESAAGKDVALEVEKDEACPFTLPWRSAAALAAVFFALWLLIYLISRIFRPRRKSSLCSLAEFSSAIDGIIGGIERVPLSREKYSNALRWKSQTESIAEAVKEYVSGSSSPLVNVLGMTSQDIFRFKRAGGLAALCKGVAVHLMESGKDLDAFSTAYRYPDISRLLRDNSSNRLLMVHPPLSESSVPEAYTDNAALNILVCDASSGWTEAHRALFESIPNCKVVMVGMETGTVPLKEEYKKQIKKAGRLKAYLPSEKRWRFIVLLAECGSEAARDKTCLSLYRSACGDTSMKDIAAKEGSYMEVSALKVQYKAIPFRKVARKILENLDLSSADADAVIMLKAGCVVSQNFFSDISAALSAGQERVQFLKYGFALTRAGLERVKTAGDVKESEQISDYLRGTIVNFS